MKRLEIAQIEATGTRSTTTALFGDGTWKNASGLPVFDVVDYGALIDGSTDDTLAWQAALNAAGAAGGARIISSRMGVSIIAGALQDTSGANAQLLLPAVDAVDSENISIVIEGGYPPSGAFSVIGATPLPDNHLVLKSTLTSGSGGALLGGQGPAGTFESFTNVDLTLRNIAFRMPSNPTHTALNLLKVVNVDLDHVIVDCGGYYVQGLTQPTTSSSYAIKLPDLNNGAHVRLGAVDVIGFYNGYLFNEHSQGEQVNAWGCNRAFVFAGAYHASKFQRLMAVHCPRGMVFIGGAINPHYVDVDQFDIEHAASGWWAPVYDIDDASNYGHGKIKWHVVLAGTGVDTTFTVNGATGFTTSRVGTEPSTGIPATLFDAKGDIIVATADDTAARLAIGSNDQVLTADSAQTTGAKWATPKTVATDVVWDAKGDIIAASGADAAARLAVGADGQVLTADAAQTLGVKWATPPTSATTALVPMVSVLGSGDPGLVWTDDGELLMIEVPL